MLRHVGILSGGGTGIGEVGAGCGEEQDEGSLTGRDLDCFSWNGGVRGVF